MKKLFFTVAETMICVFSGLLLLGMVLVFSIVFSNLEAYIYISLYVAVAVLLIGLIVFIHRFNKKNEEEGMRDALLQMVIKYDRYKHSIPSERYEQIENSLKTTENGLSDSDRKNIKVIKACIERDKIFADCFTPISVLVSIGSLGLDKSNIAIFTIICAIILITIGAIVIYHEISAENFILSICNDLEKEYVESCV